MNWKFHENTKIVRQLYTSMSSIMAEIMIFLFFQHSSMFVNVILDVFFFFFHYFGRILQQINLNGAPIIETS
jgi:uncharacterized membrane protein